MKAEVRPQELVLSHFDRRDEYFAAIGQAIINRQRVGHVSTDEEFMNLATITPKTGAVRQSQIVLPDDITIGEFTKKHVPLLRYVTEKRHGEPGDVFWLPPPSRHMSHIYLITGAKYGPSLASDFDYVMRERAANSRYSALVSEDPDNIELWGEVGELLVAGGIVDEADPSADSCAAEVL